MPILNANLLTPIDSKAAPLPTVGRPWLCWNPNQALRKVGLGTQGVLWSDARVAAGHSENSGNALMYAMSERALQLIKGNSFTNPVQLLDAVLPEVLNYGRSYGDC